MTDSLVPLHQHPGPAAQETLPSPPWTPSSVHQRKSIWMEDGWTLSSPLQLTLLFIPYLSDFLRA